MKLKFGDLFSDMMKDKEIMGALSLISQLGLTMISCILVCFFLFLFLEHKFHLPRIFLILGLGLGIISGFYSCYKILKKFYEQS